MCLMEGSVTITLCGVLMRDHLNDCPCMRSFHTKEYIGVVAGTVMVVGASLGLYQTRQGKYYEMIWVLGSATVVVVSLHISITALSYVDRGHLYSMKFHDCLYNYALEYQTNNISDAHCWDNIQEKYQCCGLWSHNDWFNMSEEAQTNTWAAENISWSDAFQSQTTPAVENASSFVTDALLLGIQIPQSCVCDPENHDSDTCDFFPPWGKALYTQPCYILVENHLRYGVEILRIYSPCLLAIQGVRLLLTCLLFTKLNNLQAVGNVYEVT